MIKYIFFDVSGTLLFKPKVYINIQEVLHKNNFDISLNELKLKHKILSESIFFPDQTNSEFYKLFNSELLYALGIIPTEKLLNEIFSACTYLPWEKFEDTSVLKDLNIPFGIISNFNTTLRDKLKPFFGDVFQDVFVSEELGIAKPNLKFYQFAIDKLGLPSNEILYIGDSLKLDIEPASKLGVKTLLIDRDNFYLQSDYAINNLGEILKHL